MMAALTMVAAASPEKVNSSVGATTTTCFLLTTTAASTAPASAASLVDGPLTPLPTATARSMSKIAPKRPRTEEDDNFAANNNSNGYNSSHSNSNGSNASSPPDLLRCKRRIQFGHVTGASSVMSPGAPPAAVARRNERERNRVRQVNLGFATLRQHVPNGAKSKKMSKVETLRSAVQYIKQLQQLLTEAGHRDENSIPALHAPNHHNHSLITHSGQIDNYNMSFSISAASSPTPSLGSDASSPYDSLSPEDEDLLDFSAWLS